jgi:hypothetical protein
MVYAFEGVLGVLHLADRTNPICDLVARTIIECAEGDFDRASLQECALAKLAKQ